MESCNLLPREQLEKLAGDKAITFYASKTKVEGIVIIVNIHVSIDDPWSNHTHAYNQWVKNTEGCT